MGKLVLIDGNSIMNRAFYGIMGSRALTSKDGKYTNALYGFLAILFKLLEDEKPEYLAVTFDLKAPTARHKMYKEYKANRKGMPNELAEQMPIIKEILMAMNIDIVEREGYEGDDILGTLSRFGEKNNLDVVIFSGDRDTFQLATDRTTIKIPRTKQGKTETDLFDKKKIEETYGIKPVQLIEVKGLQGDSSDNIPGVPGIGEKTALSIIQKYESIENLYKKIEKNEVDLKPKQLENLKANKDLAILSRTLGEINLKVPLDDVKLEDLKLEEWDRAKVYEIFKKLNFKRYIERFNLSEEDGDILKSNEEKNKKIENLFKIESNTQISKIKEYIEKTEEMIFYFNTIEDNIENKIIKEKIDSVSIFNKEENICYYLKLSNEKDLLNFKDIFENDKILKSSINLNKCYILLNEIGITLNGISYDAAIAGYILDQTKKFDIENLTENYLNIDLNDLLEKNQEEKQINLFDEINNKNLDNSANSIKNDELEKEKKRCTLYCYLISQLKEVTIKKLEEENALNLFNNIDIPTITVLANMQVNGMYADIDELNEFGDKLKKELEIKTKIIYEMAGEEFNINSTKQLGEILFEKMKLPVVKKTKSGYSTDVDVLEKLKKEDPIISEILDYRQYGKLNSTYVEGLKPYINPKTHRIHSFFHQTITATGRISSTEPNLQNIPTRFDLGKQVRKVFKPEKRKNIY